MQAKGYPVIVKLLAENQCKILTFAKTNGQILDHKIQLLMVPTIGYVNAYASTTYPFVALGDWHPSKDVAESERDPRLYLGTIEVPITGAGR